MCTKLYVKDVQANAHFFKALGFSELSCERMRDYETVALAPLVNGNAQLQLWDIEFIRQVSAEVAESKLSLLITVNHLKEIQAKVKKVASYVSEIQEMGTRKVFNFQTPNGDYMAFAEE
jgi:predicted lactoylglutathione lyase